MLPFAKRADNNATACFKLDEEKKIQLIYDFITEDLEQRDKFKDLWEWIESVTRKMIEYN